MIRKTNSFLSLVFIVLISSCSLNTGTDTSDYNKEKNRYAKKIGQYFFTLTPYSSDRLASLNYGDNNLSPATKDSIVKEYNDFLCFVMEIHVDGFNGDIVDYELPGRENSHDKKVSYYLFDMQNDLKLKNANGVETPCTIYYCERLNTITNTNRFVVGFKKSDDDYVAFEYRNPYLDCGKVKFNLNKDQLAFK